MKILVLTIEYPPLGGGASAMIHELNKEYIKAGHAVTVITMQFEGLPQNEIIESVEVHRVNSPRSKKYISYPSEHLLFLLALRKFLKKFLADRSFDYNHSHFILPTGLVSKWILNQFGIPYIITAHGSDVPGFNPDRFKFLHWFSASSIRTIIAKSEKIIAPSKYLSSLIEKVGVAKQKLMIIPNGIDTSAFIPTEKKKIILTSGRLLERKGFQYLVKAVSHKDIGYKVHICGDGPMRHELELAARNSKTPVIFHGWLDNQDQKYRNLLAQASIYCLVSTNENASITLLEALSSGCAVITSNVSGCPETVGAAGICIDPEDTKVLAQTLEKLIEDDGFRNEMMTMARRRAVEVFSWSRIAGSYLSLIQSIPKK